VTRNDSTRYTDGRISFTFDARLDDLLFDGAWQWSRDKGEIRASVTVQTKPPPPVK